MNKKTIMHFSIIVVVVLQVALASQFSRNAFLNYHRNVEERNIDSRYRQQRHYLHGKYLETTQLAKNNGLSQHFANNYYLKYYI